MSPAPLNHTPGPWHVEPWRYENGKRTVLTVQTDKDAVAQVLDLWCPDERAAECEANARLIAAAPELLDALRECADLCWHSENDGSPDLPNVDRWRIVNLYRAVLAKVAP